MLSPEELKAYLRDERAWRRAAQQPMEDGARGAIAVSGRETNWLMFRRGTSDNAFSLRFANSLRGATFAADSINTSSSHARATLPRKRWVTSVRGADVADPLQQLLARNLQRRGSPAKRIPPHNETTSALREREYRQTIERVMHDFVELEKAERREIVAAARARWRALMDASFHDAYQLLFLAELSDRRVLFRAWQEEKFALAAMMRSAQERTTNMTARQFRQLCRLIQAETFARNLTLNDERECRDLVERYAYVEYLKSLEAEIEACKRQELRLRRRIA
jgi:hypothetical protein